MRLRASRLAGLACLAVLSASCLPLCPPLTPQCLAEDQKLDIMGDVRLRMRYIDSADTGAVFGTYNEELRRGFSFRDRLVLEAVYSLTDRIDAGGMVRVSNEGSEVLVAGPQYLSSEFGSAFIAYRTPSLGARLGYYDVFYTPLTLMRWDVDDDPEGGAGCGCPGTATVGGTLLGETLEELGPTLTFEGGQFSAAPLEAQAFALDGFLARARPAAAGSYQLLTYGARLDATKYLSQPSSLLDVNAIFVRSAEDKNSANLPPSAAPPFANTVFGLAWKVPIVKFLGVDGEWTLTRTSGEVRREGSGGIVSVTLTPTKTFEIVTSYLYLSPNWESYFRALSYNPDRQGVRVRIEASSGPLVLAAFAKYLRTVDRVPEQGNRHMVHPTASLRSYLQINPALDFGVGAIFAGSGVEDNGLSFDMLDKRYTLFGNLTLEFAEDAFLTLEERFVWNRVAVPTATQTDYDFSMLSLYVRSGIW